MLKTRIISGVIGFIILLVIAFSSREIFGISAFIVTLIGLYELYNTLQVKGLKPVRLIGYFSALPILFLALMGRSEVISKYINLFKLSNYFSLGIFIMLVALFMIIIFRKDKYNFLDIAATAFGALYVSFLLSFIVLIRNVEGGNLLVWFVFIGAWSTDIFAYSVGRAFGKHKLIPSVSANKTVEGAIGGAVGAIIGTVAYGLAINPYMNQVQFHIADLLVLGILNGIMSQLGDLSASIIKRFANVKDYGNIMPGHGGVLDRFDSIMFIAPVVYFFYSFVV